MVGLWKFASKNGKERGLLALFALHSLGQRPKSGYDLLKEIGGRTGGAWVPSKGTLYPILKQLEAEKLIKAGEKGARSKNVFGLTRKGEVTLLKIRECRKESREKLLQFRNLLAGIFGEERMTLRGLLFEIRDLSDGMPASKREKAARILEKCIAELKGLV